MLTPLMEQPADKIVKKLPMPDLLLKFGYREEPYYCRLYLRAWPKDLRGKPLQDLDLALSLQPDRKRAVVRSGWQGTHPFRQFQLNGDHHRGPGKIRGCQIR